MRPATSQSPSPFGSPLPRFCSASARRSSTVNERDILPDHVTPSHYSLLVHSMDFPKWTFKGSLRIHVAITKPTQQIVLNANDLILDSVSVSLPATDPVTVPATDISYDAKTQRATIALSTELPASPEATVTIEYRGTISRGMAGFYRSKYKPDVASSLVAASVPRDDDWHYMVSTQFQSCDARRALPCWDEPNRKATFDLELEVPVDQTALSNMPVRATRPASPVRPGWHVVSFERTPVMSPYLLAWAVGDLEYVESHTTREYHGHPLPVRVYTLKGRKEQGRWALQQAGPVIDYFSEVFGIDYPLPKVDLLAVPEFTCQAMENWGLVTFQPAALLFDDQKSTESSRIHIASVIAHELAHQWFGNLVTMDWWDELWLNEGFATWVGWHVVDRMHPSWLVWPCYTYAGTEAAFALDSMRSSHPIHVPVPDALDVDQIFDDISYEKGSSVIRMLADHLGVETFLSGVGAYLRKHQFSNATTADLWAALGDASGKDVASLMGPWITSVGHPVVTVVEEPAERRLTVRQDRYLGTGNVRPEEDETVWWIPLALRGGQGLPADRKLDVALTTREGTVRDVDVDGFYLLNAGATGFYRVNYPPERLRLLGTQLDRLRREDLVSLVNGVFQLTLSGHANTPALLALIQGFVGEARYSVVESAIGTASSLRAIFATAGDDDAGDDHVADYERVTRGLDKLLLRLVDAPLKELGWDATEGEDMQLKSGRKVVIGCAVTSGHEGVMAECLRRFDAWTSDPDSLKPDLRAVVFRAAVRADPARAVPLLKREWFSTSSVDVKTVCLHALGATGDRATLESAVLPMLTATSPASEAVPASEMSRLISALSANPRARRAQWAHVRDRWDVFCVKVGNSFLLDRLCSALWSGFRSGRDADDLVAFFEHRDTRALERTLAKALEKTRLVAAFKARERGGVAAWLAEAGFGEGE